MNKFYKKISKEAILDLPVKSFEGEIYLIENKKDVHYAIEELKNQTIIGFDTETRPAFRKGEFHHVALLQLATDEKSFLFRLNKIDLPRELTRILSDENIIKAGVAIRDDIKALQKINKFNPKSFIELQKYVDGFGIEDNGLKKITANVLGFRISKGARLTNWENNVLTTAQLKYAATDAWVSFEIYNMLSKLNGNYKII